MLRGKALLLHAAQLVGSSMLDDVERSVSSSGANSLINQGKKSLAQALDIWHELRDPHIAANNVMDTTNGIEYHHLAAEALQIGKDLRGGVLTRMNLFVSKIAFKCDSSEEHGMNDKPAIEGFVADKPVDLGIMVALNEEFAVLYPEIASAKVVKCEKTGVSDYLFRLGHYNCAATFVGEMGPEEAALATDRFINRQNPTTVVMLGIAAGIDDDVKLGDVVVAKHIGRYLARAKVETFQIRLRFEAWR